MVDIRSVLTSADIVEFHRLAEKIYKDDPNYIYPIQADVEAVFDPEKNPAFLEGEAARYIGSINNEAVARIAVFYQNKPDGTRMGGIGFFECINSREVAHTMFEYAMEWLRKKGCTYMDGPVNFGDRDSFWGLLVECHTYPSYRENYQPEYYRDLFESWGFEQIIEQSTSEITQKDFNIERFSKLAARVMQNPQYHFERLDYGLMDKFAVDFVEIYNAAWAHHADFKPLTTDKIKERLREIKPVLDPAFAIFAYAGEKPIGFYISILEVNQVFKQFKGKLTLWNKIRFLLNRNKINKVRGIIFGVVPDYQNLGIETGMIMKFYESYTKSRNIKIAELAWIGDFNAKMLSMLKSLGAYTTKVHLTFRKNFF